MLSRLVSPCSLQINELNLSRLLDFLPWVTILSLFLMTTGCSSWRTRFSRTTADWTHRSAEIACYSGGKLIYSGKTDGKVFSETNSDGYIFIAADDKKLKEVSGDCIIRYE